MNSYLNTYRNKTFQYLVNAQGFLLKEIKFQNRSIWICIKQTETGNIVFVFTDQSCIQDINQIRKIMQNQNIPYNLYHIIIDTNLEDYQIENDNNEYLREIEFKIVINPESNSVVYSSDNCMDTANMIISINSENNRSSIYGMKKCYVTYGLIAINVIVYILLGLVSGNFLDIDIKTLYVLGAKVTDNIYNGQVWRLITSMFLHGDIMHIACNMYSLFAVGSQIELIFGKIKYLIIYFVSGIFAGILSCILSPDSLSVGASGAIFGLLGAFVTVVYVNRKHMSRSIIFNLLFVVFLNLYIGFTGSNIDNAAHIGGMISGLIISGGMIAFINQKKKLE